MALTGWIILAVVEIPRQINVWRKSGQAIISNGKDILQQSVILAPWKTGVLQCKDGQDKQESEEVILVSIQDISGDEEAA